MLVLIERRIGSEMINKDACHLISSKLESGKPRSDLPAHDIAWGMVSSGRFEDFKCAFGTDGSEKLTLELDYSMLLSTTWLPEHGIDEGKLHLNG